MNYIVKIFSFQKKKLPFSHFDGFHNTFPLLITLFQTRRENCDEDNQEVVEVAEDENGTKGETMAWLCV